MTLKCKNKSCICQISIRNRLKHSKKNCSFLSIQRNRQAGLVFGGFFFHFENFVNRYKVHLDRSVLCWKQSASESLSEVIISCRNHCSRLGRFVSPSIRSSLPCFPFSDSLFHNSDKKTGKVLRLRPAGTASRCSL